MQGKIILITDGHRNEILRGRVERSLPFTDVLEVSQRSRPRRFIALLSLDGCRVTHAALAARGPRVATGMERIRFEPVREVIPIEVSTIEHGIAPRLRHHFNSSVGRYGWVPNQTWKATLEAIQADPRNVRVIRELERRLSHTQTDLPPSHQEIFAEERDAAGLALKIFDPELGTEFLRSNSISAIPASAPNAPFLTALQNADLLEDLGIDHDAGVFDGWIPREVPALGTTRFERDGRTLTVTNVNRTPIEKVIGVDLLYFQEEFRSFVFVQYKRMNREDGRSARYRPRGESYESEVERMLRWDSQIRKTPTTIDARSYRLGSDAFFFKLYANPVGAPPSGSLLKGMYFPLNFWTSLVASPEARGPRGGIQISYSNAGRYLTNTDFIGLVEGAWVGTSPQCEKTINKVIDQALNAGHSVTLATSQLT